MYGQKNVARKATRIFLTSLWDAYDGAEICELIGIFLLNQLPKDSSTNFGLYRDDGLGIITGTPRQVEKIKKSVCKIFKDNGFTITIEANKTVVDFLDVTFNIATGTYSPYMKPDNIPLYVHQQSNHPPTITRNIPLAINNRLSAISSDESSFNKSIEPYQKALKNSGYNHQLTYQHHQRANSRSRRRKIIWFNPPFSRSATTDIGKKFLDIIRTCFPSSNILHKILNKNTVKISYACMPNMGKLISSDNNRKLNAPDTEQNPPNGKQCNCQVKSDCPMNNNCLTDNVIYQATVTTNHSSDTYIGLTETSFKTRYRNHTMSFRHSKYRNQTELSKHIWNLKDACTDYQITWKILKRAHPYNSISKRCNLCLTEKYFIIHKPDMCTLNQRKDPIIACRHKNKHLLSGVK